MISLKRLDRLLSERDMVEGTRISDLIRAKPFRFKLPLVLVSNQHIVTFLEFV